jgi:hypothetical protein
VIFTAIAAPYIGLGYGGMTSSTSTTIGTGSKGFVVNTSSGNSAYTVGTRVRISDQSNVNNFMEGPITAYSGTSMTVDVQNYGGSGTIAAWNFSVAGVQGSNGVTYFSGGTTGLTPASPTIGSITLAGTLIAANGGTGLSSYAVGDLLYANTTTSLASLADVAVGNALISGGIGVAPSWGKIGLTTHVSGTLPIANGGTNATATPTAGAVPYGDGTKYAFSSAGTSGDFLISGGTGSPTWTSTISGGTYA